jgi:hypothetical protein
MTSEAGEFYISDGVNRAVAARELGLIGVLGILHEEGIPDRTILVEVSQLHSPRREIRRQYKGRDFQEHLQVMATAEGRLTIRPTEIERLGVVGQTGSVPLADVRVVDEGNDDE